MHGSFAALRMTSLGVETVGSGEDVGRNRLRATMRKSGVQPVASIFWTLVVAKLHYLIA
jgi:hypothetical protein